MDTDSSGPDPNTPIIDRPCASGPGRQRRLLL